MRVKTLQSPVSVQNVLSTVVLTFENSVSKFTTRRLRGGELRTSEPRRRDGTRGMVPSLVTAAAGGLPAAIRPKRVLFRGGALDCTPRHRLPTSMLSDDSDQIEFSEVFFFFSFFFPPLPRIAILPNTCAVNGFECPRRYFRDGATRLVSADCRKMPETEDEWSYRDWLDDIGEGQPARHPSLPVVFP